VHLAYDGLELEVPIKSGTQPGKENNRVKSAPYHQRGQLYFSANLLLTGNLILDQRGAAAH